MISLLTLQRRTKARKAVAWFIIFFYLLINFTINNFHNHSFKQYECTDGCSCENKTPQVRPASADKGTHEHGACPACLYLTFSQGIQLDASQMCGVDIIESQTDLETVPPDKNIASVILPRAPPAQC